MTPTPEGRQLAADLAKRSAPRIAMTAKAPHRDPGYLVLLEEVR